MARDRRRLLIRAHSHINLALFYYFASNIFTSQVFIFIIIIMLYLSYLNTHTGTHTELVADGPGERLVSRLAVCSISALAR